MSALSIVLVVLAGLLVLFFVGGFVATTVRRRREQREYARHLAEAEQALAEARAQDHGWDREAMEQAARAALADRNPGLSFDRLELLRVDDRPGIGEDRATFHAVGSGDEVKVVLLRSEAGWSAERVE